jgi:hypothetical protein
MQVSGSAMSASGGMVARTFERALGEGGSALERSRTTAWKVRRRILIAAGQISLGSNAVKCQCSASAEQLGDGGAQARAAEGFVGVDEDETSGVEESESEAQCKGKLTWMLLLLLLVGEKGVRLGGTTRPGPERGH